MKKSLVALTLAASLGLAACSNPSDEVVVSTSYGDITQGQFYDQIKSIAGTQLLEEVVIKQILSEKYEATDEEIEERIQSYKDQMGDQFEAQLEMYGYTDETFKDFITFQILQEKAIKDFEVTDEEVKAYYDQASKELEASHILVESPEEAQAIYEQLRAGGDFAAIATEKSKDPGSAAKGGELGWFTVGTMVPEFNDAAYALEVGEISEPVQTQHGFHIIKLTNKRDVEGYGTLEEKKEEIITAIKDQKAATIQWETVEARLIEEAKVDIKDADLKAAFGLDADKEEDKDSEEKEEKSDKE